MSAVAQVKNTYKRCAHFLCKVLERMDVKQRLKD